MADDQEPATKQDIKLLTQDVEMLRSELKQNVEMLRSELRQNSDMLRSEFQHSFDDLKESMRDGQTELLKAFYSHSHAQSTDAKLKDGEAADHGLRERLTAVEFRVTEVEKRLNLPPQAR